MEVRLEAPSPCAAGGRLEQTAPHRSGARSQNGSARIGLLAGTKDGFFLERGAGSEGRNMQCDGERE